MGWGFDDVKSKHKHFLLAIRQTESSKNACATIYSNEIAHSYLANICSETYNLTAIIFPVKFKTIKDEVNI